MPDQSAATDREALYFVFSDLSPDTNYLVRASYDSSFPLDDTLETLVTTPADPDPAGFDIPDAVLVTGASDFMNSICRAAANILVFTANTATDPGPNDTQAVYQYEPSGNLAKALALPPTDHPPAPSEGRNVARRRTSLRDQFSAGVDTGVLGTDLDKLNEEAPSVDWSQFVGMVPVDFATTSYSLGSGSTFRVRYAHTTRFYDAVNERLVTATFSGSPRNQNVWRSIMSDATLDTSDYTNAPEGTVRLSVGPTVVQFRDEDDNVLRSLNLVAANSSGQDAIMVGNRVLVVDSGLKRVFSYNPDGTTVETGPPPPGLATITVNGRNRTVLGEPGPFAWRLPRFVYDLTFRPHLTVSGTSLDPLTTVTVDPPTFTFEDLRFDAIDEELKGGETETKRFKITVQSPTAGVVNYFLDVTVVVMLDVVVPDPEAPTVDPGGGSDEGDEVIVPPGEPPELTLFQVSPETVEVGETAFLTWNVVGATDITVKRGASTVSEEASGSYEFTPPSAGTYSFTIDASNDDGSIDRRTVTLTATAKVVPPGEIGMTFTTSARTIDSGKSATLTWDTTNATSVTLDGASVSVDGTRSVSPTSTTTYTLVASSTVDGVETVTQRLTIAVRPPPVPLPKVTKFTRSASQVSAGTAVTFTWTVTGASTVTFDGKTVNASGSRSVIPKKTRVYVLEATNSAGESVRRVLAVGVDEPPPPPPTEPGGGGTTEPGVVAPVPTLRVTLSPTRIPFGGSSRLKVSTKNATQLRINGRARTLNSRGEYTQTLRPEGTTAYRITVAGPGGSRQVTRTLIVEAEVPDPTAVLTASSTDILSGDSVILTYRTTNAVGRSLNGVSLPSAAGTVTRSPSTGTRYRLLAINKDGDRASDSVFVQVRPRIVGKVQREATGTGHYVYYIATSISPTAVGRIPLEDQTKGPALLGQTWAYERIKNPLPDIFAAQGESRGITADTLVAGAVNTTLSGLTSAQLYSAASCIYSCGPLSAMAAQIAVLTQNAAAIQAASQSGVVAQRIIDLARSVLASELRLVAQQTAAQSSLFTSFVSALGGPITGAVLGALGVLGSGALIGIFLSATSFRIAPANLVSMLSQIDSVMAYINRLDGSYDFPSSIGNPATWSLNPKLTYTYDYDNPPSRVSGARLVAFSGTPGVVPFSGGSSRAESSGYVRVLSDGTIAREADPDEPRAIKLTVYNPQLQFVGTPGFQLQQLISDVVDYIDKRLPPEYVAASSAAR
ncbi:MAG: hypothetical protein F4Z60_10385, partial [Chloroflexi bacterium]|nr:hypothetical protein [Chloroflexota bacterium]